MTPDEARPYSPEAYKAAREFFREPKNTRDEWNYIGHPQIVALARAIDAHVATLSDSPPEAGSDNPAAEPEAGDRRVCTYVKCDSCGGCWWTDLVDDKCPGCGLNVCLSCLDTHHGEPNGPHGRDYPHDVVAQLRASQTRSREAALDEAESACVEACLRFAATHTGPFGEGAACIAAIRALESE